MSCRASGYGIDLSFRHEWWWGLTRPGGAAAGSHADRRTSSVQTVFLDTLDVARKIGRNVRTAVSTGVAEYRRDSPGRSRWRTSTHALNRRNPTSATLGDAAVLQADLELLSRHPSRRIRSAAFAGAVLAWRCAFRLATAAPMSSFSGSSFSSFLSTHDPVLSLGYSFSSKKSYGCGGGEAAAGACCGM